MKRSKLIEKLPLVKTTRFRRSSWKTREEAFEHFRQKEKFQKFDEQILRDYIEHGTVKNETSVNLFFNPSVEAKIYQTLPTYLPKLRGKLKIPAAYIGGTHSEEARLARLGFMKKHFPFEFRFIKGSHLFPLENPLETATVIKETVRRLLQ